MKLLGSFFCNLLFFYISIATLGDPGVPTKPYSSPHPRCLLRPHRHPSRPRDTRVAYDDSGGEAIFPHSGGSGRAWPLGPREEQWGWRACKGAHGAAAVPTRSCGWPAAATPVRSAHGDGILRPLQSTVEAVPSAVVGSGGLWAGSGSALTTWRRGAAGYAGGGAMLRRRCGGARRPQAIRWP